MEPCLGLRLLSKRERAWKKAMETTWSCTYHQILFQPFVLISDLLPAVFNEKVEFRTEGDEVSAADVEAEMQIHYHSSEGPKKITGSSPVHQIRVSIGHRKSIHVITEVAGKAKQVHRLRTSQVCTPGCSPSPANVFCSSAVTRGKVCFPETQRIYD